MTILLFLAAGDAPQSWLRIADARAAEEGEGTPPAGEAVIAVAPAEAVTLHWAALPTRSPAQATAAARILAAEASAAPIGDLHVAIGDEGAGDRPIAVVERTQMVEWLTTLGAEGIDPIAIVPAPLLLPRPDEGFARGVVAGVALVRGRSAAFADEGELTKIITDGVPPVAYAADAIEAGLVAAASDPALDLRQGVFARRRRRAIDWRLVRRLVALGAAILAVTLAIDLVRILRYSFAADALEARAEALARGALPRGETVTDSGRQLDERLSRKRGPGLGYSATLAAIYDAVRSVPGSELTALDFQPDGTLRLGVACEREAAATDLKRAIEARGLAVRSGTFQSGSGRVTGEFTVSVP